MTFLTNETSFVNDPRGATTVTPTSKRGGGRGGIPRAGGSRGGRAVRGGGRARG